MQFQTFNFRPVLNHNLPQLIDKNKKDSQTTPCVVCESHHLKYYRVKFTSMSIILYANAYRLLPLNNKNQEYLYN